MDRQMAKMGRPKLPRAERLTETVGLSLSRAMLERVEVHAFDNLEGAAVPMAIRDLIERGLKTVERKR